MAAHCVTMRKKDKDRAVQTINDRFPSLSPDSAQLRKTGNAVSKGYMSGQKKLYRF